MGENERKNFTYRIKEQEKNLTYRIKELEKT